MSGPSSHGANEYMITLGLRLFGAPFMAGTILLAPAPSRSAEQTLVGMWFTQAVEDGIFGQIIYDRRPDGTFSARMRAFERCLLQSEWREAGTWSYRAGAIEQATTMVDGATTDYHDTYRVLSQGTGEVRVLDIDTNVEWPLLRVKPDFEFPPPPDCPAA